MSHTFTVALFGHRITTDFKRIEENLTPIIKDLIEKKPYVIFLIGRNGEFDEYAASIIKSAQHKYGIVNSELTLVLPYMVADIFYYQDYYDSIHLPDCVESAHPKSAITKRNRWMVERADLVIVDVEKSQGGAYTAMRYAEKLHTRVINLADSPQKYQPR